MLTPPITIYVEVESDCRPAACHCAPKRGSLASRLGGGDPSPDPSIHVHLPDTSWADREEVKRLFSEMREGAQPGRHREPVDIPVTDDPPVPARAPNAERFTVTGTHAGLQLAFIAAGRAVAVRVNEQGQDALRRVLGVR